SRRRRRGGGKGRRLGSRVLAPRATRKCTVPPKLQARAGAAEVAESAPLPAAHTLARRTRPFSPSPSAHWSARVPHGRLAAPAPADEVGLGDELPDLCGWIAGGGFGDVAAFVPGDLGEQAAGDRGARLGLGHVLGRGRGVAMLDQEPARPAAARRRPRAHEDPRAFELLAMKGELQLTLL